MLKGKDYCSNCNAWHGVPPLEHLPPGEPCAHDPVRPCIICGQPVGALSIGGSDICCRCDCGYKGQEKYTIASLLQKIK